MRSKSAVGSEPFASHKIWQIETEGEINEIFKISYRTIERAISERFEKMFDA